MFSFKKSGDVVDIKIATKRFDATNVGEFKKAFNDVAQGAGETARVDLADVEFIDSSGVGALLSVKKTDRVVELVRVQPAVLSVIELLRLNRVFKIKRS